MRSYTDDNVLNAYLDVQENGLSLRKAVEKHGVPR